MKSNLHRVHQFFSKFLHLRRMEEKISHPKNKLLDYTKFDPKRTIIVDVDGTILNSENRDYVNATEIPDVILKLNKMHEEGWTVIYFTARGQLSKNGDFDRIERENRPVLERWLKEHNVRYDYLLFHKPYGAWYVDDKNLTPDQFLMKEFS